MIEFIVKIEGYLRLSFSYGSSSSSSMVSSQCWTGAYTTAPSGEGLSSITEGAPWKSHCDSIINVSICGDKGCLLHHSTSPPGQSLGLPWNECSLALGFMHSLLDREILKECIVSTGLETLEQWFSTFGSRLF